MTTIISWAFIALISIIGLFFFVVSIYALYRKKWKAGAYCLFLSGIAVSLEANPLKNMLKQSQQFVDGLMWVLAFCVIGLFITVIYDWSSGETRN